MPRSREQIILPFDVLDYIVRLVSDRWVLKKLTFVSRYFQRIADQTLFCSLIIQTTYSGMAKANAICFNQKPRIVNWRSCVKYFGVVTVIDREKHNQMIHSVLKACPNIVMLYVAGVLHPKTLQLPCPALTRLSCSFAPYQLGSVLNSSLIRNVNTLQPTYVAPEEWPLFINSTLFERIPHLTQMALSGHAFRVGQLMRSLQNIRPHLPDSFELLIISVPVYVAQNDPAFTNLMTGQVDRRFVGCVPMTTADVRWPWALMKLIFEEKAEWVWRSEDPNLQDFWEEARALRDARNHTLGL
ncbi:hypothetical protein DL96DRAFT_1638190 [Flagelloscypha sp. PMI_526]|nr:hypothetical protein DL96DRAFT_1638190 [Flagelloscypha sp. PMI_526]